MEEELQEYLGEDWFEIVQRNFPFIITEEDIFPFHMQYVIHKSGVNFPQFCERATPVEKVRLPFDIDEVSKVFPNIVTEEHLAKAFIKWVEVDFSAFFYMGYDVDYNVDTFKPIYKEYLTKNGVKI